MFFLYFPFFVAIFTCIFVPTLQAEIINSGAKSSLSNNVSVFNSSTKEEEDGVKNDNNFITTTKSKEDSFKPEKVVDSDTIVVKGDSSSPTTNPRIIITKEDIVESHATNLVEVLQNQPEITVVSNGGFGQNSLMHINGSLAQHVQILLNGVALNDPSNAQPFFDVGQIPLNFIESIEIITGANSVKYGSGAIAGIININTIHSNKTMATLEQSIGSFATLNTNAGVNLHIKDVNITMFGTLYNSKGYSVALAPTEGKPLEDDASNVKDFNTDITYNLNPTNSLEFFYKVNQSHADYDGFDDAYVPIDSPYNYTKKYQDLAYFKYKFNLFDNTFNNEVMLASGKTKREYHEIYTYDGTEIPSDTYFNSQNQQLKYSTNYLANSFLVINGGLNMDNNQALVSSYDDYKNTLSTNMYVSIQEYLNSQTFLEQGVSKVFFQHDGVTNTDTDSYYAYNLGLNYTNTSLFTTFKLNYGTAYRLPSIYELYADTYGNINLDPELSKGVNFSMDSSGFSTYITDVNLSLYYLKVDDLISFVENTYNNVGNYTNYGLDIASTLEFSNLKVVASYGYLNSNDASGKQAPLIPTHKATVNFIKDFDYINFNTQLIYAADIIDISTGQDIALDNYLIVNLITSYKLRKDSNLYFKIENLFNKDYVTSYGYTSSSRAYYMGILYNV